MSRLLIVSNRLPVTAQQHDGTLTFEPSVGGLATGLRDAHHHADTLWIGWPGELTGGRKARREIDDQLRSMHLVPVHLTRSEIRGYYDEVANGVLWPVFQYFIESIPLHTPPWETFRGVNERFADAVAAEWRPGDLIWVHDYHLLLLPSLLRTRLPEARIGFFLHIPFPSDEVFSILPWRDEILRGILGADVIGFHTASYLRHFCASVHRVLGIEADAEAIQVDGRSVRVGAFPMGVDARSWAERGESASVLAEARRIRESAGGRQILLGIDRLDYTKGILRRLLAIQQLLGEDASLRDRVRVIQVTVPSREKVDAYARFNRRVDELVGAINGDYTTPDAVPIHRVHQSLNPDEVAALYRAADVLLVTSLRDGMNLVAKEFVATRSDGDGVLVLSEFAGAADELREALLVNPYDVPTMASTIRDALDMPESARRTSMRAMREVVLEHDVQAWVDSFLSALNTSVSTPGGAQQDSSGDELVDAVARLRGALRLEIVLDYDGTLVSFVDDPDEAVPDSDLVRLLTCLAARPGTRVHIVSGRSKESLERWLGHLPASLYAEHGLWRRPMSSRSWHQAQRASSEWKEKIRPTLSHFVETTPGSFIEEKSASLVWHYRKVRGDGGDEEFGEYRAQELHAALGDVSANEPLDVIAGSKAVEVRSLGVHKGTIVPFLTGEDSVPAVVLAIGDDRTDEDLFAALPPNAACVHVGDGESVAQYRVRDVPAVRRLLSSLLTP